MVQILKLIMMTVLRFQLKRSFLNSKYLVEGEVLSSSDLKESVLLFPESKNLYSRSKTMFYISLPFVVTSGFFFGYELGNVVMGEELNYTNISIGAGLQVINLLFQYLSNRDLDLAVESYNSKL